MKLDLKSKLISLKELKEYGFELCTDQSISYVNMPFSYFLDKEKQGLKEEILLHETFKNKNYINKTDYISFIEDKKQLKKEIAKDILNQINERVSNIIENKRVFLESLEKRTLLEKLIDFASLNSFKTRKNLLKIEEELDLAKKITVDMIENVIEININRIPTDVMFNIPNDFEELLKIKKLYLSSNQRPNSGIYEYNIKEIKANCHYSYNGTTSLDVCFLADVDFSTKEKEYKTERNIYLHESKSKEYFYLSDNFVGHKVFSSLEKAKLQYDKYLKSEFKKLEEDYERLAKNN